MEKWVQQDKMVHSQRYIYIQKQEEKHRHTFMSWKKSLVTLFSALTFLASRSEFERCSLWRGRKLWTVRVWDGALHAAVSRSFSIAHLLFHACPVMTPASSIKLCAIASYRLFHSHAQVLISYSLDKMNIVRFLRLLWYGSRPITLTLLRGW